MARPKDSRVFVPNGESRRETAVLLVGTAGEIGMDTRLIRAVSGGFFIPDDLADVLYDAPERQPEEQASTKTTKKSTSAKKSTSDKKASGNRAVKDNSKEEE